MLIYRASAGRMFQVLVEKHGVNGRPRQKGKTADDAAAGKTRS